MSSGGPGGGRQRGGRSGVVLRVVVAAALAVEALIHLRLAPGYQQSAPDGIGAGNLFRLQAATAIVAAVWVLARGSWMAFMAAAVTALGAVAAVVLYRYVDVPAFGPIPAMFEPVWFFEKTLSALAAALALVLAAMALARGPRYR